MLEQQEEMRQMLQPVSLNDEMKCFLSWFWKIKVTNSSCEVKINDATWSRRTYIQHSRYWRSTSQRCGTGWFAGSYLPVFVISTLPFLLLPLTWNRILRFLISRLLTVESFIKKHHQCFWPAWLLVVKSTNHSKQVPCPLNMTFITFLNHSVSSLSRIFLFSPNPQEITLRNFAQ